VDASTPHVRTRESHDRIGRTHDRIRVTRERLQRNQEVAEHADRVYREHCRIAVTSRSPLAAAHCAMIERASALVAISNGLLDLSDELVRMSQRRCPARPAAA